MKALIISDNNQLQFVEKDIPTPATGQVLVKVAAAALNKRDQFIIQGKYPGIKPGSTLGSDGVGEVVRVGAGVSDGLVGRNVIINPNISWGDNPAVQSSQYNILGMPSDGTFAEYVPVDSGRIHDTPSHMNMTEAAALPLAGLTAFRACFFHGKIERNQKVLISGFGGGVAQFAFQFAVAKGADVYVSSSSEDKIAKAVSLGAIKGYNYRDENWMKEAAKEVGGFDVIIDSAGGEQVNQFIKIMRPAGRIIFYGATNGLPSSIDLYRMFWNQITLQGSTMGNDEEFKDMLAYTEEHRIVPILDSVRPFPEAKSAFEDIQSSDAFGKLVLDFTI